MASTPTTCGKSTSLTLRTSKGALSRRRTSWGRLHMTLTNLVETDCGIFTVRGRSTNQRAAVICHFCLCLCLFIFVSFSIFWLTVDTKRDNFLFRPDGVAFMQHELESMGG